MTLGYFILYAICTLTFLIFWKFFLYPYLKTKITFTYFAWKLKKIRNKQTDPEQIKLFDEIISGLKQIAKDEKLLTKNDDEDEEA